MEHGLLSNMSFRDLLVYRRTSWKVNNYDKKFPERNNKDEYDNTSPV